MQSKTIKNIYLSVGSLIGVVNRLLCSIVALLPNNANKNLVERTGPAANCCCHLAYVSLP